MISINWDHLSAYMNHLIEITPSFLWVCVVYSLVFFVVSCVLLFVCLSFSFLAMVLSVYFRFMSLTVPLVSFAPLLFTKAIILLTICWMKTVLKQISENEHLILQCLQIIVNITTSDYFQIIVHVILHLIFFVRKNKIHEFW